VCWYRKAAEQRHVAAQCNVNFIHCHGQGVPKNHIGTHKPWDLVAASGNADADDNRAFAAEQMTSAQIAEAHKLARECLAKNYNALV
jgi:TPR repeat protein